MEKTEEELLNRVEKEPIAEAEESAVAPPQSAPSKRDMFGEKMKEWLGEKYSENEDDNYDSLIGLVDSGRSSSKGLAEMISKNPRFAQVLSDLASGKRGASAALARYFGKDLLSLEEGSPEYEEMVRADEERMKEVEDLAENERQYKENLERTMPVFEKYCSDKGKDAEDFKTQIWEKLIFPVLSGEYTEELCAMFDKGLNYDKDVEDALSAGEIKGRNTNINKMREERGDGMPKGMTSQVIEPKTEQRKSRNSLLEKAIKA